MSVQEPGHHSGGSPGSTPKPPRHPPKPEWSAPPGRGNLLLDFTFLLIFLSLPSPHWRGEVGTGRARGTAANGRRVPRRRGKLAAITLCCFKQIHKFYFAERICNSPPITQAGHGPLIHYLKKKKAYIYMGGGGLIHSQALGAPPALERGKGRAITGS